MRVTRKSSWSRCRPWSSSSNSCRPWSASPPSLTTSSSVIYWACFVPGPGLTAARNGDRFTRSRCPDVGTSLVLCSHSVLRLTRLTLLRSRVSSHMSHVFVQPQQAVCVKSCKTSALRLHVVFLFYSSLFSIKSNLPISLYELLNSTINLQQILALLIL